VFGRTDQLTIFVVIVISAVAAVTDLARGRVYNWLTFPALFLGVLTSLMFAGMSGLGQSILGAAAGLFIFGGFFWFGAMGGGDVKLLMALGAWCGARYVEEVSVLSVLIGGVLAFFAMLFTGRLKSFVQRIYHFFLTIFVKELAVEAPKLDHSFKMPFAVPMSIAAVWVVLAHPLEKWGLPLWP